MAKKPKVEIAEGPVPKRLPLWEQWAPATMPHASSIANCKACSRSETSSPLPGDNTGTKTDILVVVGQPTLEEDTNARAFIGGVHNQLRRAVTSLAPTENVRFVYSTHCRGNKDDSLEAIEACRAHVRWEMLVGKPRLVIAFGTEAIRSMVGSYVDTTRIRKCWTFVDGVQTVLLPSPVDAHANKFATLAFNADLAWAVRERQTMPKGSTQVLQTGDELRAFLRTLNTKDPVILDIENNGGLWDADFELLCCGICQDPERPAVATPDALREAKAEFAAFLANPRYKKANQAIKHDRHALYRFTRGVDMAGIMADTFLWARLREPEAPAGLGPQSWTVGFGGYKEAAKQLGDEDGEDSGKNRFARMLKRDLYAYNGRDVAATALLVKNMRPQIQSVWTTWRNLIGPAFDALTIVERTGMLVSETSILAYDALLNTRRDQALAHVMGFHGVPADFNPGSSKQLSQLLYKEFKLPVISKTDSGAPSTDKTTLKELFELTGHKIIPALLDLAIVRKQLSTYGLPMLDHVDARDGRIHTTFNLVRTGRLSSSRPNLQNIGSPQEPGDDGSWARGVFIAPEGHKLINLDYSQAELRMVCMLSGDKQMAADFNSGHDYHTRTASGIFGVKPEGVTKQQRKVAKCFHPDTEVLTRAGWKRILDVVPGEEVVQATPGQDYAVKLEWVVPTEVFEKVDPDGLVHLYSEGMDLRVTTDHRMLGWRKSGNFEVTAPNKINGFRGWANAGVLAETVAAKDGGYTEDTVRFAIMVQADGSVDSSGAVRLGFSKQRKIARCQALMETLGVANKRSVYSNGKNGVTTNFRVSKKNLPIGFAELLPNKQLHWGWLGLSQALRKAALEEAQFWDSCKMGNWRAYRYSSVDKINMDVLQAMGAITGLKTRQTSKYLTVRDRSWSRGGNLTKVNIPGPQRVACLSVPSTFVLVRDRGVPVITGQTINFGLVYGQTDYGLSKTLKISLEDAQTYIAKLFKRLPELKRWRDGQIHNARARGKLVSVWNPPGSNLGWELNRSVWPIAQEGTGPAVDRIKKHWENIALNTPVQGLSSCFTLASVAELVRWTQDEEPRVKVIMTVHDSIVLEVPDDLVASSIAMGKSIMTQWATTLVPMVVDAEVGQNWGAMEKWVA